MRKKVITLEDAAKELENLRLEAIKQQETRNKYKLSRLIVRQ